MKRLQTRIEGEQRIINYIRVHGPQTSRELTERFGKSVNQRLYDMLRNGRVLKTVTSIKENQGITVMYSLPKPQSEEVAA